MIGTEITAALAAKFPYVLHYTRRGGRNTGVGLVVGSRSALSREHAESIQQRMEQDDARCGHVTDYSITLRSARTA